MNLIELPFLNTTPSTNANSVGQFISFLSTASTNANPNSMGVCQYQWFSGLVAVELFLVSLIFFLQMKISLRFVLFRELQIGVDVFDLTFKLLTFVHLIRLLQQWGCVLIWIIFNLLFFGFAIEDIKNLSWS